MISSQKGFDYNGWIESRVREIYEIAREARSKGYDVSQSVEIPLASDMADRVEELIQIKGIAQQIRELSKTNSREEVSIIVARKAAELMKPQGKKVALDKAVRVGLAILTEGILVAPLEGIAEVSIGKNDDGSDFASIVYSGPIRGAGGTAQALSVIIADIVRRDLGIGKFRATEEEVDRYVEEVEAYNRLKHLQYLPSQDEIKLVVRNSPVLIDGEGSEEEEISGHRDMKRIATNRIRGGMCLVLCEGLIQKSRKILKYADTFSLEDWSFLSSLQSPGENVSGDKAKSEKFLKDIIAGRPVFSHPGKPGGFRLHYGRSRLSGLAAASVSPVTMVALDEFIATGCQLKVELPGKAAAITPCDSLEGPMVLLEDGSHIMLRTVDEARELKERIVEITDIGEILISYGDFLENNHALEPPSFTEDWWNLIIRSRGDLSEFTERAPSEEESIELSLKEKIPVHPRYNLFWHDITKDEYLTLSRYLSAASTDSGIIKIDYSHVIHDILVKLGVEFGVSQGKILIKQWKVLRACLIPVDKIKSDLLNGVSNTIEAIREFTGMVVKPRSPTRIGARMGRPEKAGDRKMKPKVHVLFPVENYGESRRSIGNARNRIDTSIDVEINLRKCEKCGNLTPEPICELCGSITTDTGKTQKTGIDLDSIVTSAEERVGISLAEIKGEFKGVKKLMSSRKICEPIEKGIIRAKYDVTINKDGTCRFDMSDIPLTHFYADEIDLREEMIADLGYHEGMNEIYPQDIIIPVSAGEFLLRVTKYIDDLLVRYYGMEPFYRCNTPEDLIGHIVIGLAPHTSGGIIGRIIGFTKASGCYAHPLFHAAKRRNCDGDEDSIMLLLDGLLNFSRGYLPSTRGGLMDAPLVVTSMLNPDEVDKEAMNLDTLDSYPLDFYISAEKREMPASIEKIMRPMKIHLSEHGKIDGIGFTHNTGNINSGVIVSSYKTIGSMKEKIERQLRLATLIRAVDQDDVAARVLNSHFLPDIYGNFRKYFTQEFRCTACNAKYRRVPLSGRCSRCGNSHLNLTIHKGSIIKYLDETLLVSKNYNLPPYLMARIENIVRMINDTFSREEPSGLMGYGVSQ